MHKGALLFAAAGLVAGRAYAANPYSDLGIFPGAINNDDTAAVSGDGQFVSGTGQGQAFRWDPQLGFVGLGLLPGGSNSFGKAISDNGSVVVGQADDSAGRWTAFRWTAAGMVPLGFLAGGSQSDATAVNADGTIIVGSSEVSGSIPRAFRWTAAGGMASLGTLHGGRESYAAGVSADGQVVVGYANDGALPAAFYRAYRWTQATGMVSLGTLNGGEDSYANAISGDGTVIVGKSADGQAQNDYRAFRWTQAAGMQSLGLLPGGDFSEARAVNATGSVIVGVGTTANGTSGFRWTQAGGMTSIEQWLRSSGVSIADGTTSSASGVSRDGQVVVGQTRANGTYIARVVLPTPAAPGSPPASLPASPAATPSPPTSAAAAASASAGSGLIVVDQFVGSLAASSQPQLRMASTAGLVIDGNHSAPLRGLPKPGERMAWASGDVGRADHGTDDAAMGSSELGLAYGMAPGLVAKAALGRTFDRSETPFGGRTSTIGSYILPEVIAQLPTTPLWLSVSGFYLSGETSIRRGYLNAGRAESGFGAPDQRVMAGRVRMDWKDALKVAGVSLTPYTGFTRTNVRLEGYTETGGAWLVAWNKRQENVSEGRVGVDAELALATGVALLARAEWVHRFDTNTGSTGGQLLGPGGFAFDFGGQQVSQNWARLGLGLEADVGPGTLALTANATTQGTGPSTRLYTGYRVKF